MNCSSVSGSGFDFFPPGSLLVAFEVPSPVDAGLDGWMVFRSGEGDSAGEVRVAAASGAAGDGVSDGATTAGSVAAKGGWAAGIGAWTSGCNVAVGTGAGVDGEGASGAVKGGVPEVAIA